MGIQQIHRPHQEVSDYLVLPYLKANNEHAKRLREGCGAVVERKEIEMSTRIKLEVIDLRVADNMSHIIVQIFGIEPLVFDTLCCFLCGNSPESRLSYLVSPALDISTLSHILGKAGQTVALQAMYSSLLYL